MQKFTIKVGSPTDSEYIQKKAFEAGYKWQDGGMEPKLLNTQNLHFNSFKDGLMSFTDTDQKDAISWDEKPGEILELLSKKPEPEFKAGDWIIGKETYLPEWPRKINLILSDTEFSYENGDKNAFKYVRHATPEEIEKYLISEANRLFPIGTWFISSDDKNRKRQVKPYDDNKKVTWYVNRDFSEVRCENGMFNTGLTLCSNPCVYKDGKWAEIVASHPSIVINGYPAEFHEWGISFNNGCAKIDKRFFTVLAEAIESFYCINHTTGFHNKNLTSVKIGKGEFTSGQIKQISEHFKNR
jgi:hypothetical protein